MDFNRKGYAGHNDWRLPNIDELSDLIWCGVEAKPKEGDLCSSVVPGGKAKMPAISNMFAVADHLYISSSRSHKILIEGSLAKPKEIKIDTVGVVSFYSGYRAWIMENHLFDQRSSPDSDSVVRLVRGGSHAPKK